MLAFVFKVSTVFNTLINAKYCAESKATLVVDIVDCRLDVVGHLAVAGEVNGEAALLRHFVVFYSVRERVEGVTFRKWLRVNKRFFELNWLYRLICR